MKLLLKLTSILEAATGLALIAAPAVVVRLLLGAEISGAGFPIARVGGFGLLALGLACWPCRDSAGNTAPALRAMLTYNSLVTIYFFRLGIAGGWVGPLLWPAAILHAAMAAWCVACLLRKPPQ